MVQSLLSKGQTNFSLLTGVHIYRNFEDLVEENLQQSHHDLHPHALRYRLTVPNGTLTPSASNLNLSRTFEPSLLCLTSSGNKMQPIKPNTRHV